MSNGNGLEVAVERIDAHGHKIACVRAVGEVDLANAEEFDAAFSSPEAADCAGMLLDLTKLDFMDSSGLRVVLSHAQAGGPRFATILKADSAIASLFEMVDVLKRINIAQTEEEALARLGAAADGPG